MTQNDLNRQVARATGETISVIRHLGFQLEERLPLRPNSDPNAFGSRVIDWDDLELHQSQPYPGRDLCEPAFV